MTSWKCRWNIDAAYLFVWAKWSSNTSVKNSISWGIHKVFPWQKTKVYWISFHFVSSQVWQGMPPHFRKTFQDFYSVESWLSSMYHRLSEELISWKKEIVGHIFILPFFHGPQCGVHVFSVLHFILTATMWHWLAWERISLKVIQ